MNEKEKCYQKSARRRAKEYRRKKRGYKTKAEKVAFRLAEKVIIQTWKDSLSELPAEEAAAQKKAFRTYLLHRNKLALLIACGAALLLLLVLVLVLL